MDPVLDSININALRILLTLLFFPALFSIFASLFLERLKLLDLLTHEFVSVLEIRLKFVYSLVLVLGRLLVG